MSETFTGLTTDDYTTFDKYQKHKIEYLNEVYDNRRTQEVYWGIFQRFVNYQEVNKKKDLFLFNSEEIEEILKSIPTTSIRTKRAAWTGIYKYLDWAIKRGYNFTGINPCKDIRIEDILKVNKNALAKKVYTLKEVYNIAIEAENKGSQYQEILALLLPRYGVLGKESNWLVNLRWEDIDRENKVIYIINRKTGELESELDIDNDLINWIDKAKEEKGYTVAGKNGGERPMIFYDRGYVFKTTKKDKDTVNKMVLYSYLARVCVNAGVDKISTSDLVRSRKVDLLNEINETNKELTVQDFKFVSNKFSPNSSYSTYSSLLDDYKLLTGFEIKSN